MANKNDPYLSGNITFVQAEPSTFRTIVQRLTGAPSKLHERRQNTKKLEKIQLNGSGHVGYGLVLGSPVSPFDMTRGSPTTPSVLSPVEEEEKAILEKRYYLHPSPTNVTRRDLELLPLFPVCSPRVDPDDLTSSSCS